jgi:hypothetical protein
MTGELYENYDAGTISTGTTHDFNCANFLFTLINDEISLLFGTTQLFVFVHPDQQKKSQLTYSEVTFELAQEEIASKAGYDVNNDDQSMEAAILNKDLSEVIPVVDEANSISQELEKNVRFEIMLVAPQFAGKSGERTEVSKGKSEIVVDGQRLNLIKFI